MVEAAGAKGGIESLVDASQDLVIGCRVVANECKDLQTNK
jgi:hypothetical protein